MEIKKLTESELDFFQTFRSDNIKKFYKYSAYIILGFIIISLIPLSFLPKSYRLGDSFDKSQNLIQTMGFQFWALTIIPFASIFIIAIFADLKIIPLKKDIESGEKINDIFYIKKIINEPSHGMFSLILESKNVKKLVIHSSKEKIGLYTIGQECNIWYLRHSKIVFK